MVQQMRNRTAICTAAIPGSLTLHLFSIRSVPRVLTSILLVLYVTGMTRAAPYYFNLVHFCHGGRLLAVSRCEWHWFFVKSRMLCGPNGVVKVFLSLYLSLTPKLFCCLVTIVSLPHRSQLVTFSTFHVHNLFVPCPLSVRCLVRNIYMGDVIQGRQQDSVNHVVQIDTISTSVCLKAVKDWCACCAFPNYSKTFLGSVVIDLILLVSVLLALVLLNTRTL